MYAAYHHIANIVQKIIDYPILNILDILEIPKDPEYGDIALPCFVLAQKLQKSPVQIAEDIAKCIVRDIIIQSATPVGPYVNFIIQPTYLAQQTIPVILSQKQNFGRGNGKRETIVIESPSPNTNKPLHLGHVRNMLLGNALDLICSFAGYKTIKVEVVNDRGIHICKSMLAYQLRGNNAEPTKKPDHFVGDRYVRFSQEVEKNPDLEEQAHQMLRARELGDPKIRSLRKKMNQWALEGFQTTYSRYGTRIDKTYYESAIYEDGKAIVYDALHKGIFVRDPRGNIAFPIHKNDGTMSYFVVLRSDDTAVYATQDLALVQKRFQDYKMDRMIYVVGNEQEEYFKVLFSIIEALGYTFAQQCYHLSYGMISLPEGKMKSRTGTVVEADELADQMHKHAANILRYRYTDWLEEQIHAVAERVAMAAIKFFILKYEVSKDFVFDPQQSLSFEGETGPYMLYTYARCAQIVQKATYATENTQNISYDALTENIERKLLLHLAYFPTIVEKSADSYKPNLIARYILDLAQLFNRYYQQTHIIVDDTQLQKARVALVASVQQVLANSLQLLGIEVVEKM